MEGVGSFGERGKGKKLECRGGEKTNARRGCLFLAENPRRSGSKAAPQRAFRCCGATKTCHFTDGAVRAAMRIYPV